MSVQRVTGIPYVLCLTPETLYWNGPLIVVVVENGYGNLTIMAEPNPKDEMVTVCLSVCGSITQILLKGFQWNFA